MKPFLCSTLFLALSSTVIWADESTSMRCDAMVVATPSPVLQARSVVKGLNNPWGLAFLPDGRMLVTERSGQLRLADSNGSISKPFGGVPAVHAQGQGGLLDIALDPDFAANQRIYLSYAESGSGNTSGTAVFRARLDLANLSLHDGTVIFRQSPKTSGNGHYGSRLVFGRDSLLFVTLGERQKFDPAQDGAAHLGKVVRIRSDGSIPPDNPFAKASGVLPQIWSLGHRNPQGAALHPQTGQLWVSEHGAMGGDEINIARAGKNYGWPIISYGRHYGGGKIGEGSSKSGIEQPACYWDPSIAPGNMTFYTGQRIPQWQGSLFVTALKDQMLVRLTLDGNRITGHEKLLTNIGKRLRDVRVGPDGWLYLLTDERDGEILRVSAAER